MPTRDLVVIGTSAGGITALKTLAASLPADTRAAVFVVIHTSVRSPGVLPEILARAGPLSTAFATDGAPIEPGRILIGPPDRHLMLDADSVRLARGPKENRVRPAIDVLFRSAAFVHRSRVIGVVLTGELDDGAVGLWTIKHFGGTAIVQDPAEASAPSMPRNALAVVQPDHCVRVAEMGPLIARLAQTPSEVPMSTSDQAPPGIVDGEVRIAMGENPEGLSAVDAAPPSSYACPECNGVLRELPYGPRHFRCRTGHAYSMESLLASMLEQSDAMAWSAVRAYMENVQAIDELVRNRRAAGAQADAERLERLATQYRERAEALRVSLTAPGSASSAESG